MAGKQRVDCEPAQLAQRTHELLEAAVVDALEQDRAAVEDDVAGEQASAPAVLEQERKAAFAESLVDGAGLEAVVGGIPGRTPRRSTSATIRAAPMPAPTLTSASSEPPSTR